jgi:hypothetical protein
MTVARSVADVLDDHLLFEVESIDRMYLNVWQPRLAYGGGVAGFFVGHEQSSRPVDEDLLGGFGLRGFVGSFDELAVDEHRVGADERDQVWGVDRAPAVLCGLDQLERHRQPGRA